MIQEMKIALPIQKQAYAVFFVIILSLVRGVTYSGEIGIALEAPMAVLALTFCAGTIFTVCCSRRIWNVFPVSESGDGQDGGRRPGKRDKSVSCICCCDRCYPCILGASIESSFLSVPEYVGRDWRLPAAVADYQFQYRRQIFWSMESVLLCV